MTTSWFNLISWPVKRVCKFSSLFGNYAKGQRQGRASGHFGHPPCLLIIIVPAWSLLSGRHQLAHHRVPAGISASPPRQFLEHIQVFSPKTQERTRRPLTIRRFSGSHFPCKMQRGAVGTEDYINFAPGQTWRGEISIIWHMPQLVTLPDLELGWEIFGLVETCWKWSPKIHSLSRRSQISYLWKLSYLYRPDQTTCLLCWCIFSSIKVKAISGSDLSPPPNTS